MLPDVLLVIKQITRALDQCNVPYLVGGSVASSTLGKFRFTNDIDFVVDIRNETVDELVAMLRGDYYVDPETITDALKHQSSFSVLHLDTMVKADMFIKPTGAWSESAWSRRKVQKLENQEQSVEVYVRSAEDMILQKLNWYRIGREVSDRQWSDIIGMLEVQSVTLDYPYMETWAEALNVTDLLRRAYNDAGIVDR
jgi:hypothetical protein